MFLKSLNLHIVYYVSKIAYLSNQNSEMTVDRASAHAQNVFTRLIENKLLLSNHLDSIPYPLVSYLYSLLDKSRMNDCPVFFYCNTLHRFTKEKTELDLHIMSQWRRFMHWLSSLTL